MTRIFRLSRVTVLLAAALGFAPCAAGEAATFGTDTRALQRFQSDFFLHGGYLDDSAEFDQLPNGEATSIISGTDSAIFNTGGANPISVPVSANYFASADLATGKLKVLAENPFILDTYTGHARSNASFTDTILLNFAPEMMGQYVKLSLRTRLDGTMAIPDAHSPGGSVQLKLAATYKSGSSPYITQGTYQKAIANGGQEYGGSSLTHFGNNEYGFDFFVTASNDPIKIFALLSADAHGSVVDYSHTANLKLLLPENVAFSSASGVFLQNAGVVPEPATWAMLILGFGFVGTAMRRSNGRSLLSPAS